MERVDESVSDENNRAAGKCWPRDGSVRGLLQVVLETASAARATEVRKTDRQREKERERERNVPSR